MAGFNLPPGVSVNNIPGNEPDDDIEIEEEEESANCERCEERFLIDDMQKTCDGHFCSECYDEYRVEDADFCREDDADCLNEW